MKGTLWHWLVYPLWKVGREILLRLWFLGLRLLCRLLGIKLGT